MPRTPILELLLFGLVLLLAGSCSDQDAPDVARMLAGDSIYIRLTLAAASTTRATAGGGETGDGIEDGINHENEIHRLSLFFYRADEASGIESENSTTALIRVDVSSIAINQPTNSSAYAFIAVPQAQLPLNVAYHLVVVANGSTADLDELKTLGDLQNFVVRKTYNTEGTTISEDDDFVMVSRFKTAESDATYTLTEDNTYYNPLGVSVTLERLAARIDIVPVTSSNGAVYHASGAYYSYPVGTEGDSLRLTNIKAVNCMQAGSYLMKHLAGADSNGSIADGYSLIGVETLEGDAQTNYVLDPWTRQKTADATTMDLNGTSTDISDFYQNYFSLPATTSTWDETSGVEECETGLPYILTYTQENTMDKTEQTTKYTTGLLLRGIYVPHTWYVLDNNGVLTPETTTAGTTFYTFDNVIYGSTAALAKGVNAKLNGNYTAETVTAVDGVQTYTDGVCYYRYWIRHNDNNEKDGIMEFAIVRNCIYRITLNAFKGIGGSTPKTDEEDDEYMEATIHVLAWSLYLHSTIYM